MKRQLFWDYNCFQLWFFTEVKRHFTKQLNRSVVRFVVCSWPAVLRWLFEIVREIHLGNSLWLPKIVNSQLTFTVRPLFSIKTKPFKLLIKIISFATNKNSLFYSFVFRFFQFKKRTVKTVLSNSKMRMFKITEREFEQVSC